MTNKQVSYVPKLECLEKTNTMFKLKRINTSYRLSDDGNVTYKENSSQTLYYNLITKEIKLFKEDEEVVQDLGYYINLFFKGIQSHEFISEISTTQNKRMYEEANRLWNGARGYTSDSKGIYNFLSKLKNEQAFQILANCGFYSLYNCFRGSYVDKEATKPHEILGLPKVVLKYIKDVEFGYYDLQKIQKICTHINGNSLKLLFEIVKEESQIRDLVSNVDYILDLYENYGYKDIKKLALYVFRETKLTQGIEYPSTTLTNLRDYARMSSEMGIDYEKYPKSLKKAHDLTILDYRLVKSEIDKKNFVKAVEEEEYRELEFKDKEYVIITPQEPKDLIDEGEKLSHCVSSYVKDVIAKKCKILFMRDKENVDKPLVTVEVRGENIRQVRGFGNRKVVGQELEFISKWANKKNLVLSVH
jgi:hypothetical protein